nr:MAG: polyprotein 2 [Picornavirales sp.]
MMFKRPTILSLRIFLNLNSINMEHNKYNDKNYLSSVNNVAETNNDELAHNEHVSDILLTGDVKAPLEMSGTMKTGMTQVTTFGDMSERQYKKKVGNALVYRPPKDLFDRMTPVSRNTINPGKYGHVYAEMITEANFLTAEALQNANGYTGIRATLVYTLVVAAPPQASGILKLAWWPISQQDDADGYPKILYMPMYSQVQNVELNIAESSTVTLKVPFQHFSDYLRISPASPRDYGAVAVGTYLPIGGTYAATSVISCTVYVSYEDVELINPGTSTGTVIAQSGLESKALGPVTQLIRGAKKIIDSSIGIPSLSAYTSPVSWALGGVGALAAHYGWSRPNDGGARMVQPTTGRNHNNVLGICNAVDFGMFSNNEVKAIDDISSTNVDEMSICYLTCIPSPIFRGNLTANMTPGQLVYTTCVNPKFFFYQVSTVNAAYTQLAVPDKSAKKAIIPTPHFVMSQIFNYWRGDLVFRVKFARSKFSAGRVLVAYNPKPDSLMGEVGNTRYNFPSKIIDLRTDSHIDLDVPFTYPLNMCSMAKDQLRNIGNFFIRVVDPIIVPNGVATEMPFIVEVFSKCGMSFGSVQPADFGYAKQDAPIYAQSGLEYLTETIGESVLSVKQLLQRPSFKKVNTPAYLSVDGAFTTFYSGPAEAGWVTNMNATTTDLLCAPYRYVRGSMVCHIINTENKSLVVDFQPQAAIGYMMPKVVEHGHNISVKIPYWSNHKCIPMYTPSNIELSTFMKSIIHLEVAGTDTAHTFDYSWVAGDDFQLGGFTGFAPMAFNYAH